MAEILPQTPSAYAEFRSVRFVDDPANTRDDKREPPEFAPRDGGDGASVRGGEAGGAARSALRARALAGGFAVAFGDLPSETQAFLRRILPSLRSALKS